MKLTKLIYICSPYTYKTSNLRLRHKIQKQRYEDITKIAGKLEEIYPYAFILPITMSHQTAKYMDKSAEDGEFKYWARRDFTYISRCDELWVIQLKGWDES